MFLRFNVKLPYSMFLDNDRLTCVTRLAMQLISNQKKKLALSIYIECGDATIRDSVISH